jgi:protocatechuate 3,4-dioxygenase beta subunit
MKIPSSMKTHPQLFHIPLNRRRLLHALFLSSAGLITRGAFAEMLTLTPHTTAGPYYPDHLPLDQDNDLIRVTDDLTPAIGTVTNLSGRILDVNGAPLKGALVELWQADDQGCYLHTRGVQRGKERDAHFQGYGKFETAADGGWRFRTIKPGLYTGRTRHYHFGITLPGQQRRFTTQLFFAGEPGNERDMVLQAIRDAAQRASVIREFTAIPDTTELVAKWDIVMGLTPSDGHDDAPDSPPPGGPAGPPRPRDGQRPPPPPDGASLTPSAR